MDNNIIINLVNMCWQSEFYHSSQIKKEIPLTNDDKRKGVLSRCSVETQCPKILRIGLMQSNFYPVNIEHEGDFQVSNVKWLLEYYNMNGAPPFTDDKRDLPRTVLCDSVEDLLSEVEDIIHSAEYQAAEFMDAVIRELCNDIIYKKLDNVAALDNVYRVENSIELRKSIMAWLLGTTFEDVDDTVNQIQQNRDKIGGLEETLNTFVKNADRLIYARSVMSLL